MAVTKLLIAEQALRRIKAGNPSVGSNVHLAEIKQACMDVINSLLRPQYFETLSVGERNIEGSVLVTYEGVTVSAWRNVSKCTLPAIPIALPRNQGVFRVYNADDVLDTAFIPASAAEMEMIATQPESLSTVLRQIAYKVRGTELIFNKDLTAQSPTINAVTIELVVADYSQFTDYELLPLDANLTAKVIETVVQMFAGEQPRPQIIDPTSDTK